MGIPIYLLIGVVWGLIAAYYTKFKYNNRHGEITFILNALLWPIAILVAIGKGLFS